MSKLLQTSKPVVFIGAAGEMCRVAIERFATASEVPLLLADINTSAIEPVVAKLPTGRATIRQLDLFEPSALADTVKGALLVVLAAGPYQRTSKPVLEACLEAKVPYLDFDDDVESTQAALNLYESAKEKGVACYIGCGASPGLTNVMAVDAAKDLDKVDTLDVCWLVGDERPNIGKAVLEHLLHIAAGPCLTWANGRPTVAETWVETGYAPMLEQMGETLLHETAHPEPVTLPRIFPEASRIRCLGGLGPAPLNGIARGLGNAVRRNALSTDDAIEFLYHLIKNPPSTKGFGAVIAQFRGGNITLNELFQLLAYTGQSLEPWRFALMGMIDQIWNGECTIGEVLGFIVSTAQGKTVENHSALLVRAVGSRNGHPAISIKRTPKAGKDCYLAKNMGSLTGTSCAAFLVMALEAGKTRSGVFCPEDWAEPQAFYKALERVGTPRDELDGLLAS